MMLKVTGSRVPVQLRKDLVAEVKSSLKPDMDFNVVYGQLLSRLEKCEAPSIDQARLLLQNPGLLVADHMKRQAASRKAQENLKTQVVNANIPERVPDRDELIADTLGFIGRFPMLTAAEVKAVTLLRLENGNCDLRVVHVHEVVSPDELAEDLENAQPLEVSSRKPGARFSASCQIFLLKDGESLQSEPKALPAEALAMEV